MAPAAYLRPRLPPEAPPPSAVLVLWRTPAGNEHAYQIRADVPGAGQAAREALDAMSGRNPELERRLDAITDAGARRRAERERDAT